MKKIISLILAVLMCAMLCTPVLADDGDEAAKLILLAKERFDIDDGEFVFSEYSKDGYGGKTVYYLRWESREEDGYSYQPSIYVRLDDKGNVEYYRLSKDSGEGLALPAYSEEEALAKAEELLKIIAPDRADGVAKGEVKGTLYTVTFQRLENKIPVSGDYITLTLDPQTLELTRYSASRTDAEFPAPDGIIAKDDAKEEYKKHIGYELLYNIVTEKNSVKKVYLSYAPKSANACIDAFTGEAKLYNGGIYYSGSGGAMMNGKVTAEDVAAEKSLSAEEKAVIAEIEKMLTKSEAEAIVRGMSELDVPADAPVSAYAMSKNRYGEYTVGISFSRETKDNYYYARAELNAATKELLSFWQSADDEDEKAAEYGSEKAKDKAEALLKKYYGEKFGQTSPEFTVGESEPYEFSYDRYFGGVRVKGNGLTVHIGRTSGKIEALRCNWVETDFPDASVAIDINEIYKESLSDDNFNAVYLVTEVYGENGESKNVSLAYAPQNTPTYSAEEVAEIDANGKKTVKAFSGYNDISGHWCESAANDLAKIGIYFEGESLKPEENATDEEFLKCLLRAVFGVSLTERDDIFRYAVSDGVIDESDIGKPLTRMNAIRYTVNALGFKKAAEIEGIYNCPFGDVSSDMLGYAALAAGLDIVSGQAESFRPDDILTRSECIAIIHNCLKK